jgi:hypothetical protein
MRLRIRTSSSLSRETGAKRDGHFIVAVCKRGRRRTSADCQWAPPSYHLAQALQRVRTTSRQAVSTVHRERVDQGWHDASQCPARSPNSREKKAMPLRKTSTLKVSSRFSSLTLECCFVVVLLLQPPPRDPNSGNISSDRRSCTLLLRGATLQTVHLTEMIPSNILLIRGHIARGVAGLM